MPELALLGSQPCLPAGRTLESSLPAFVCFGALGSNPPYRHALQEHKGAVQAGAAHAAQPAAQASHGACQVSAGRGQTGCSQGTLHEAV